AHVGVHAQKQPGLNWIGVVLPVGKMTSDQVRALAKIAAECGDGQIRLTVWQNFIFSGVPDAKVAEVEQRVLDLGLTTKAAGIRSGLV
ncbi:ferredoxin--nitrite reductase, partial [Pseudomonas sp. MPR-R1B]